MTRKPDAPATATPEPLEQRRLVRAAFKKGKQSAEQLARLLAPRSDEGLPLPGPMRKLHIWLSKRVKPVVERMYAEQRVAVLAEFKQKVLAGPIRLEPRLLVKM